MTDVCDRCQRQRDDLVEMDVGGAGETRLARVCAGCRSLLSAKRCGFCGAEIPREKASSIYPHAARPAVAEATPICGECRAGLLEEVPA